MKVARALGRAYGFKVHTFWQPKLLGEGRRLTPKEQEVLSAFPPDFVRFARTLKQRFKEKFSDFDDLSDVFDSEPEQVYLDDRHVTPRGNALAAARIIRILDRRGILKPAGNGKAR
jgi:hypothetical protein